MKKVKTFLLLLLLAVCVLTMTGCGESGKYKEAQAYAEAGEYVKALDGFLKLGSYEDAREQYKQLQEKIYGLAQTALNEGRFQEASDLAFMVDTTQAETLYAYAETALTGTSVQGLVYEAGRLSCQIHIAASVADPVDRIRLKAKRGDFEGTAFVKSKPGETNDDKEHFTLDDYRTEDGGYTLDAVELSAFPYSSDPSKKAVFYNAEIFVPGTTFNMSVMGAYEAIAQDGRKGYAPALGLLGAKFVSVEKTFAGGQVAVDILSDDKAVFTATLDIPEAAEGV